jgi:CubicO group peptidase (beta-lactamase class C family)
MPTFFEMYPEGRGQPSVAELLRDYGHIVAPAGERYEYSNLGMAVLAEIVARQSGKEFGQYLQTQILTPLGMSDSFFDTDVTRRAAMAVRYDETGEPFPFYTTATPGSGEMYASAHDLARFAMFHLGDAVDQPKLLTRAQLDELHRPATDVSPPAYTYAMGWQVLRRPGKPEVLYHGGGQSGVAAEFVLVPSHDVACVVLSNRSSDRAFIEALRNRMLQTVVPSWDGIPMPADPELKPFTPLADYVGDWRGALLAQGQRVPVTLIIDGDRQGSLAVGTGPATPITDLGLLDGLISGDSKGDIGSPDTRREHLEKLNLSLKLRGTMIDGEIIAWDKSTRRMVILPYWVELHRQRR